MPEPSLEPRGKSQTDFSDLQSKAVTELQSQKDRLLPLLTWGQSMFNLSLGATLLTQDFRPFQILQIGMSDPKTIDLTQIQTVH